MTMILSLWLRYREGLTQHPLLPPGLCFEITRQGSGSGLAQAPGRLLRALKTRVRSHGGLDLPMGPEDAEGWLRDLNSRRFGI